MRRADHHLALLRAAEPALAAIEEDRRRAPKRLRPLLAAIAELLFEPDLDLDKILDAAGFVDPEVLNELSDEVGETAWSYARGARLETAAHLLLETPISIQDIGQMVGYGSIPTFRNRLRDFLGMPASQYRRQARKLLERAGPAPAGAETCAYWERMLAGELTDDEARALDAHLTRLAPASAPSPAAGGDGDPWRSLRRVAAEGFAYTCGLLPPAEQRRLIRDAVWFPDATLFERFSQESRKAASEDPESAVQWALLGIDSLAANGMLESRPRQAALAWARLARARWLAGDEAGAEEDVERSDRDAAWVARDALEVSWAAERGRVAAAFHWFRGRRRRALELAELSVGLHREAGSGALVGALLLRAELRAATAGDAADEGLLVDALTDLEEARGLRGTAVDRDLVDLWCRLLVSIDDHAETMAALSEVRRSAEALGAEAEPLVLWLEGHCRNDGEPLWRRAREGFTALGDELWGARVALDLSRAALAQDRAADAAREVASALGALVTSPDELAALQALGRAATPTGSLDEAHLDAAELVLRRLKQDRRASRALRFAL